MEKKRIKYCILFYFIFRVILHNRIISFGIQLWFFFFNGVYDTFIHCKTFFVRGVKTIFNPLAFFRNFPSNCFRARQTGKLFHTLSLIMMLNFVKILINLEESIYC